MGRQELSPALKRLVRDVLAVLGEVVAAAEGRALYDVIESVRRLMVVVRDSPEQRARRRALRTAQRRLARLSRAERAALARSFTIYLELVNVCENAYRTHRLRSPGRANPAAPEARARAVFVMTAHPTESRSPQNVRLMHRIQELLVAALGDHTRLDIDRLRHLLHLVWRVGTHPPHKPTVEDEARHLFSLLSDPVLEEILDLNSEGHSLHLHTWVGGDKDGHPGVGPAQTRASLGLSRERLASYMRRRLLLDVARDIELLGDPKLSRSLARVAEHLHKHLAGVRRGDGGRVVRFARALQRLRRLYRARVGRPHPSLERAARLLEVFPGLVVPLELREERGAFGARSRISAMLRTVAATSEGGRVSWYVRGCVVSMTLDARDIIEAQERIAAVLGAPEIPVVPLFELPEALERAPDVLAQAWAHPLVKRAVRRRSGCLEVMLGYSDTAKRMGMLPSRLAIHHTMSAVGAWAARAGVRVVFFHGSGGSVGRGGGTIAEQAATWPGGATAIIKQTLQGEMVERTLATPEILRRQVIQIAAVQAKPPQTARAGALAQELSDVAREVFARTVAAPEFLALVEHVTPYARLGELTIGSRPSRRARGQVDGLDRLRAIPWVLCWTQTRYLLPVWLGLGSAWRKVRQKPGSTGRLRRALEDDPFLRSALRQLGFTLAKTAPAIWKEYQRSLGSPSMRTLARRLEREFEDVLDLARCASPTRRLLPDRPWLVESIRYRAPMIHPLNLLQIGVLEGRDMTSAEAQLFRETVTGIAAGMLTTG